MNRRAFLGSVTGATGVLLVGENFAGAESRWLRRTVHRVPWAVVRPLTISHLTDLHIGWGASPGLLSRAMLQCRLSRPDLTVLTGDYLINSLRHLNRLRALVRQLPRPCVVTLGNHDHHAGAAAVTTVFSEQGIPVLSNRSCRLNLGGTFLTVVGIDDACTQHHDVLRAMSSLRPKERALVLTHDPELAPAISRYGPHLVLAGHTHGGQIYIPLLSPLVSRLMRRRYLAGWYRVGPARLYVNVGVGCASVRFRLGTRARPELAVFKLTPTSQARP